MSRKTLADSRRANELGQLTDLAGRKKTTTSENPRRPPPGSVLLQCGAVQCSPLKLLVYPHLLHLVRDLNNLFKEYINININNDYFIRISENVIQ